MKFFNFGKIGRNLIVTTTISGMIFITYVFYSFWEIDHLFATNAILQREVDDIETSLHTLYQSLLNQESGQRGYNLTSEAEFLESFMKGTEEYQGIASHLLETIEKQPRAKADVLAVVENGNKWHEQYALPLIEMTKNGQHPSIGLLQEAKVAFDEFRSSREVALVTTGNLRDTYRSLYWGKITTTMRTLFIISIILIGLFLYIIKNQTKSIVHPILLLNKSVKAYTKKDFTVGIPPYKKEDELAELIENVNTMRLELHEKFTTIESLADLDGMTGLYNRRYFDEKLANEWRKAKNYCKSLSLILFDIDYFKDYNDAYGHLEGDQCLKRISSKLIDKFKNHTDIVARYGGEEFAIILPEQSEEMALLKAEKLRKAIIDLKIPHPTSNGRSIVTISVGVASMIPSSGNREPSHLIALADQALYNSKNNGRNYVTLYSDTNNEANANNKQKIRTS